MVTALHLANYWWIALGVLLYFGVEAAAAIRFGVLLRVQGIRLSNARVGALFFIGMFYNQFMPGGTGSVEDTRDVGSGKQSGSVFLPKIVVHDAVAQAMASAGQVRRFMCRPAPMPSSVRCHRGVATARAACNTCRWW